MNELKLLEKDLTLVKARAGRPELIQKLEAQIARLKDQSFETMTKTIPSPETQFDELFQSIDHEIRTRYVEGTNEFISKHHPSLAQQIDAATQKMREIWKKGHEGEVRIDEFVAALKKWRTLHIKAIELFGAKGNKPF